MNDGNVDQLDVAERTAPGNTDGASAQPTSAVKKAGKRRNPAVVVVLAVAVLAGGGYGIRAYLHSLSYEDTDNAFIEGIVVRVSPRIAGQVVRVGVKDNQHVAAGDLLVEVDSRDIQNRLDGTRASLKAAEARLRGAEVDLATIRKTAPAAVDQGRGSLAAANAAVDTAKVRLASAQSAHAQAKAHLSAASAAIEESKAATEAADAEATRAKADLGRYESLYKTGGITASQLDQYAAVARATAAALKAAGRRIAVAEAQAAEAEAGIKTAEEMVRVAQSQVKETQAMADEAKGRFAGIDIAEERLAGAEAQMNRAAADVEQLKAEVRQAQLDFSYTRICAAQPGTVTKKSVEEGDYIRPGQALLGLVADEKWVVANFKESQLQHMKPGQPVSIRVDAYPEVSFNGHVDSVQEGTGARFSLLPSENATGNYVKVVQRVPVKIMFDGPLPANRPLSLGMSVLPEVKVK